MNKKLRKSSAYRDIDDSEYCDHPKQTCSDDTTVASHTAESPLTIPAESKMATKSIENKNRDLHTQSGGTTRGGNREPLAGRRRCTNRKVRPLEVLVLSPRLGAAAHETAGPNSVQVRFITFYILFRRTVV